MLIAATSGVSMTLGGRTVVRDVTLDVRAGEVVALIGPNGAGKSSLLKLLAGEAAPDRGTVTLFGRPLSAWPRQAIARRRAVVPQDTYLDFAFTALEVVLIGRSPHLAGTVETRQDRQAAMAALARVHAAHLADRLYPTLSGGERQRVQIARALTQLDGAAEDSGRCLLLDEHTANLDPAHRHGMFQIAREVAAEGAGVLAVVHDFNLAAAYADRIAVMDEGRLIAFGEPEAVLSPEVIGAAFGISCALLRSPLGGTLTVVTAPHGPVTGLPAHTD